MGEPWKRCKPKLQDDIVNGIVPDDWDPEKVHSFRDIYVAVNFARFKANLANLRQKMATELDRAIQDDEAFQHDEDHAESFLAASRKPKWDGSAAQRLLKEDMDAAANANLKPAALQATRPEYAFVEPKVFRKHVHQEQRSRKESPYWSKKKEDKDTNKKKQKKNDSATKDDECEAFLQSLYQA
jgi:hypothetical protein